MVSETINSPNRAPSGRSSESRGSTTKATCSLEKKRKASTASESPRKRLRSSCGPAQSAVTTLPVKGVKRKASTPRETPAKKQERGTRIRDSYEEDRTKQLPGTETSKQATRENDCEPSPGCSSQSAPFYNRGSTSLPFNSNTDKLTGKYEKLEMLGEGGFGSVYAGRRKTDNLPVAIKHIKKDDVKREQLRLQGKTCMVPLEVLLMIRVGSGPSSVGESAAVSILDWYDLAEEVVLVMERPVPCVDLFTYMTINGGPLQEDIAKNIMKQTVDAAQQMLRNGVFHRDIKVENLLIETGSHEHRVRVIDFGCGCLVQEQPYSKFSGTEEFAPPEFFTHGRYEAAPTTVWQLGTLLYEMLDGKQQFTTAKFLSHRVSFNIEMSQDCKHFLQMCLTQRPERRATMKQMQEHPWLQNPAKNKPCETKRHGLGSE